MDIKKFESFKSNDFEDYFTDLLDMGWKLEVEYDLMGKEYELHIRTKKGFWRDGKSSLSYNAFKIFLNEMNTLNQSLVRLSLKFNIKYTSISLGHFSIGLEEMN